MTEWFERVEWNNNAWMDEAAECPECSFSLTISTAEKYDRCPNCNHPEGDGDE